MSNRQDRRRTKQSPSTRVESQHRRFKHRTASVQDRVVPPSPEEMRRSISNGECPFCGERYKNIAVHTYHAHGVDRYELKEMAGIPKTTAVCAPELSEALSEVGKREAQNNPERIAKFRQAFDPRRKRSLSAAAIEVQRRKAAMGRAAQVARASTHDIEIAARVEAGETVRAVADSLDLGEGSVRLALRRMGITRDLRATNSGYGRRENAKVFHPPSEQINKARSVIDAKYERQASERMADWRALHGDSYQDVHRCAEKWGIGVSQAAKWLKAHGADVPNGRAAVPLRLDECGTMRGYRMHRRDKEQPCSACREENARVTRSRRKVQPELGSGDQQ